MADKEATVYIVDVGKSMGRVRHGRNESDLDWAMRYVWDGITTTVSYESEQYGRGLTSKVENGRKTAMLGVVGLNTNGCLFAPTCQDYVWLTLSRDKK